MKKIVFCVLCALGIGEALVAIVGTSLAYSPYYTHPDLTEEIAQFFNFKNTHSEYQISQSQMQWLRQGAIEEDDPPRWINHFYDPVHNHAWSGKHFGTLSEAEGLKTGTDFAPRMPLAAVDWATNQNYQAAYGQQKGNQTWQKAIKSYIDGDKKTAFVALGHVLHLIEDSSVPDHTRDDTHAGIHGDPGSPYEDYTKDYTNLHKLAVAEVLNTNNSLPFSFDNLAQAFDHIAHYSNENFFSEDTISNDEFLGPNLTQLKVVHHILPDGTFRKYLSNDVSHVAFIKVDDILTGKKKYSIDDQYFVLPSYVNRLFPEIVLTGEGVMRLFFREVEKYKEHPELLEPIVPDSNQSLTRAIKSAPKLLAVNAYNWYDIAKTHSSVLAHQASVALGGWWGAVRVKLGLADAVARGGGGELVPGVQQPVVSNQVVTSPALIAPEQNKNEIEKRSNQNVAISKVTLPVIQSVQRLDNNDKNSIQTLPALSTEQVPTLIKREEIFFSTSTQPSVQQATNYAGGGGVFSIPSTLSTQQGGNAITSTGSASDVVTTTTIATTTPPATTSVLATTTTSTSNSTTTTLAATTTVAVATTTPAVTTTSSPVISDIVSSTLSTVTTSTPTSTLVVSSTIVMATSSSSVMSSTTSAAVPLAGFVPTVVINEIAWAGTAAEYPTDEWFELYNTTDQSIDLKDWKILVSSTTINFKTINNTLISPHGYFLFKRTRDETIRGITADIIYTLSGGFNNKGEKVELVNSSGQKADEVDCATGWFAGDTVKYRSMERRDAAKRGSDPSNWQSNQSLRVSGRTFNGGQVYGSPKQSNFGFYSLNYTQEGTERILTPEGNPYILQYYQIPAGFTLTIEPGVVIKSYFADAKIDIRGQLKVNGTVDKRVIFTSGRDSEFSASDVATRVGNWSSPAPQPKDWQGLQFYPGAAGSFRAVTLRYGGHAFRPPDGGGFTPTVEQAIRGEQADITLDNVEFNNNSGTSLFLKNASSTIRQSNFAYGSRALEAYDSNLLVTKSSVSFFTHTQGAFYVRGRWPILDELSLSDNTFNPPYLDAVTVAGAGRIGSGTAVYITNLIVPAESTLTVEPGVSLIMAPYASINIQGSLFTLGTPDFPVQIMPYTSSEYWGQIIFNGSTSTLHHTNIQGANHMVRRLPENDGMLLIKNSNFSCDHCSIVDTWESGNNVYSTDSMIEITASTIGNNRKPSFSSTGIRVTGGELRLNDTLFNNLTYGLYGASASLPNLVVSGITTENFINVDQLSEPRSWFDSWLVPITTTTTIATTTTSSP